MKTICFIPSVIKDNYPNLLGKYTDENGKVKYKYSAKLLAAEIFLYYGSHNTVVTQKTPLPTEEELRQFLIESKKTPYFDVQMNIALHNFQNKNYVENVQSNNLEIPLDYALISEKALEAYGIKPEPKTSIARREQCEKELSFLERSDASEFLYRTFSSKLNLDKTSYDKNKLSEVIKKQHGTAAIWDQIYNDCINVIIHLSNPVTRAARAESLLKSEISRRKLTNPDANTLASLKNKINELLSNQVRIFVNVANNFTALVEDANYKLLIYEDLRVNPSTSEVEDSVIRKIEDTSDASRSKEDTDSEIHARGVSFSDDYNTISSMSTLSKDTRRILNSIKQLDSNGMYEKSPYGLPRYMDGAKVHAIILDACRNMIDEDDLIPSLEAIQQSYPWIEQVLELFNPKDATASAKNNASRLKTLFFRDMNRSQVMYFGEFKRALESDTVKVYNSERLNRSVLSDYLMQRWSDNFQSGHTLTTNGSIYGNNREFKRDSLAILNEDLKACGDAEARKESTSDRNGTIFNRIKHVLNGLAIDISDSTLENALKNNFTIIYSNLAGILDQLKKKTYFPKDFDLIKEYGNFYKTLALYFQADAKDAVEPNIREGDTTRYTFVQDNHIQRLVKKLKNVRPDKKSRDPRYPSFFEEFMNNEFKQYDWFYSKSTNSWNIEVLNDFEKDSDFRKAFELSVLLKQANTESSEFRSLESLVAHITEFSNGIITIEKEDGSSYQMTRYITPLAAEAGVVYMMTLKKYDDINVINKRLVRILIQEVNRILECRKRKQLYIEGKLKDSDLIDAYDDMSDTPGNPKGGKKFHFFPQFNTLFNEDGSHPIIDLIKEAQTSGKPVSDIESILLNDYIKPYMEDQFANELKYYRSVGLMEEDEKHLNIYFNRTEEDTIEFLRNFFYNSCYAQAQIIELLGTDLAFYKNHAEFIKRAKEYHASGTRVDPNAVWHTQSTASEAQAKVSDGNMRFIIANDVVKRSINADILKEIFDAHNMNAAEKKVALSLFESVNQTDAQSFRTLKSYRKIMIMKGAWSDDLEATYNRIRNNEWSWADINSMFGAIKPYVYSSIPYTWDDGDKTHMIKQNVQIKTAEAALLTLYAQICTMGSGSKKLQALVRFMENENADGNDIDVLVFESAVKHGGQGKLDLENSFEYVTNPDGTKVKQVKQAYDNSDEGVQAMLEYLEEATGLHSTINSNVVHTVSYRDYLEQQQVPEHIFDAIQLIGTQLRKLITADIKEDDDVDISSIPGLVAANGGNTSIKYRQLLNLYNKIVTENVLQAFNELRNDFMSIEKVEELLKSQVMNSSDYSPDLLDACTLITDANGNKVFNMPLHDPIQSRKVQALLSSVLKNRINKQTIKGGACVQVAAYTYDLNIKFKSSDGTELMSPSQLKLARPNITKEEFKQYYKDAHIAYVECYLPAYSSELIEYLKGKSSDGIFRIGDLPKEIRDKVCRMIGYRIPTEDKYSMLPLKIVGFLPQSCSSTIMLPADWVAISGSDFDVDKLYMMFRELYLDDNKELKVVEYDYSKEPQDQDDLNGSPLAKRNNAYLDIIETILCSKHSIDKVLDPGHFINQKIAARVIRISKNLPLEAIEELKQGRTDQELYNDLCNMTTKQLDAILAQYEIPQNPLTPSTWAINRERIANSGSMIGVFANHNVNHALLQRTNVRIKDAFSFTIDGDNETRLNLVENTNGTRILKHNAENIGASVDDVKDPTLADTNINMFTGDVFALLSDLGHKKTTVAMLLNQPVILEMTELFMRHNAGESKFDVIDNIINKYMTLLNANGVSDFNTPGFVESLSRTDFKGSDMFHNILSSRRGLESDDYTDYLKQQLQIALLFNRLAHVADDLSDIVRWCKADTTNGAAGPDIATTTNKITLGQRILDNASNENYTLLGVADGRNPIIKLGLYNANNFDLDNLRAQLLDSPFPIVQAMYTCGIEAGNEFFKGYFPFYGPSVQAIVNRFERSTRSGKLEPRLKNLILRDLTLYWLTGLKDDTGRGMFDTYWDAEGREYTVGKNGMTYGDILNKWVYEFPKVLNKIKASQGDSINPILNRLIGVLPNEKQHRTFPSIVFRNVGHLNTASKYIAGNQLYDLLDHNDLTTRRLAKQLMVYAGLTSAFDFGPNSYIHLANVLFRKEAHPLYLAGLRSMLNSEFEEELALREGYITQGDEYFYEFMFNHLDERALVPEVTIDMIPAKARAQGNKAPASFTLYNVSTMVNNKYFTDRYTHDVGTLLEFICINQDDNFIYYQKFADAENDSVTYRQIFPIGLKNELVVYQRKANSGYSLMDLYDTIQDLRKAGWGSDGKQAPTSYTQSTPEYRQAAVEPQQYSVVPKTEQPTKISTLDMQQVSQAAPTTTIRSSNTIVNGIPVAQPSTNNQTIPTVSKSNGDIILTDEQQKVVDNTVKFIEDRLRGKGNPNVPFITIQGMAGTGKTTIVKSILEKLDADKVYYGKPAVAALSRKAVHVLHDKLKYNFPVSPETLYTLAGANANQSEDRFAIDPKKSKLSQYHLIFVDEASMVGPHMFEVFKDYIKDNDRTCIVFLGDFGQLRPIPKGFDIAEKSPIFTSNSTQLETLTQRIRQGEGSPILGYADRFYNVSVNKSNYSVASLLAGNTVITDNGALILDNFNPDTLPRLAELFKKAKQESNPNYVKIIAGTNKMVDVYNNYIHNVLFPEAKNEMSVGDMIIFNAPYSDIDNAEEGIIVNISPEKTTKEGIVYKTYDIQIGDNTYPVKKMSNDNASLSIFNTIKEELRQRALNLPSGKSGPAWAAYYAFQNQFADFNLGYAITTHKAQGSTYDIVAVDANNIISVAGWDNTQLAENLYTAMTRSRNVAIVLTTTANQTTNESFLEINSRIENHKNFGTAVTPKVQKHSGNWTRQEVLANPNILYVFTDNTDRDSGSGVIPENSWYSRKYGTGHHYPTMTAAVIRGLENARPISTQRWYHQGAKGTTGRWTDNDVFEFTNVVRDELNEILREFSTGKYNTIMFPDGDSLFNTRISNITRQRTPILYNTLVSLLHEYGFDSLIPADAQVITTNTTIPQSTLSITPAQAVDKKATAKGSISNKYIGFAEGIVGSSTAEYARQAGDKANVGIYSPEDTVFVSIPGMRGNAEIRHAQQDKTIQEALKALNQGATLITDNEAYTNSSYYNEGEKKLAQALKNAGAVYSERTVDGQILGVWKLQQSTQQQNIPATPTASYGVEVSNGSQDFFNKVNQGWLNNHPNGIIAYRLHGDTPQSFTPEVVNSGWIGNPFNWQKVGTEVATTRFYNWLKNGNIYNEPNATEVFRQAIIQKILATPAGSPILYYKELGRPSHATVIGYLIANKQLLQNTNAQHPSSRTISEKEEFDKQGEAMDYARSLKGDYGIIDSSITVTPTNDNKWIVTWESTVEESSDSTEEKPECGGTGNIGSGNRNNTLDQVINNFNN